MAEGESSLAVLVDYENMARPGAKGRADFDIHAVLNRLSDKGRVIVKRAYADWSRYRDARHELQNAGLGLIEMPSAREGAKNRADIQLVVDAMELAYSRTHVDDFVVVSGDSDFTPLVGKLRELGKRVIGVGNRDSASELLIANCDEFIFYDSIAKRGRGAAPSRGTVGDPDQLIRDTLVALSGDGTDWPLASVLKDSMRRKSPAFDQSDLGFSTFSKLLEDAAKRGVLKIETDPRSGTYRVALPDDAPLPDDASAPKDESGSAPEGGGRRRRRGRGRRGGGGGGTPPSEPENVVSDGAEVFEVVVTPQIDESTAAELPPIDQPISYEDMIMLGPEPEAGEDVPDLMEASDSSGKDADEAEEKPRRGRRRRRKADDDTADAEKADEAATSDDKPAAEAGDADAAEAEGSGTGRRRRVRRRATEKKDDQVADAPEAAEPQAGEPEAKATPTGEADEQAEPTEEAAPKEAATGRSGKRIPRKKAAEAEKPAEGDATAEEEKPKTTRRRRTTKKADEAESS